MDARFGLKTFRMDVLFGFNKFRMDARFGLNKFRYVCTFFAIATIILSLSACTDAPLPVTNKTPAFHNTTIKKAPSNISDSACIDVHVHVLGDVIPNSTAFLHAVPSTEYDDVMRTVQRNNASVTFTVNHSQGFMIPCLAAGQFAIMIPTSSYNCSVGYPLPDETCTDNLSIKVAFQGGNYLYAVGVFEILWRENNQICDREPE